MSLIFADIILVVFIFLMFRAVQFDNETILREAERASVLELLVSSFFVIGGFSFVHSLMYGLNTAPVLGSQGIILIVCYELVGMFVFILFKSQFVHFLRWCDHCAPFLLKAPLAFELFFCCYLLAINIF